LFLFPHCCAHTLAIRFNALTFQRFNGGEAGLHTLMPLLLDLFYGVQGKFLKIFGLRHE